MTYKYHGEPKEVTDYCEDCKFHRLAIPQEIIDRFPEGHCTVGELGWCVWGSTVKRLTPGKKHRYVCSLLRLRLPWNSISEELPNVC